jgi:ABC-type sulfate transport system substrate-binding protein
VRRRREGAAPILRKAREVAPHALFKEAIFFIFKKTLKRGTPTTSPEKQNSKQPIYNFLSYPRIHTTTEDGIESFTRKWQQNETYTRTILIQEAHGKAKQSKSKAMPLRRR